MIVGVGLVLLFCWWQWRQSHLERWLRGDRKVTLTKMTVFAKEPIGKWVVTTNADLLAEFNDLVKGANEEFVGGWVFSARLEFNNQTSAIALVTLGLNGRLGIDCEMPLFPARDFEIPIKSNSTTNVIGFLETLRGKN